MAWWVWVLIVIGIIVGLIVLTAIISMISDTFKAKKDPEYLTRKVDKLKKEIQQEEAGIAESKKRQRRNDEMIQQNNEWIQRVNNQMALDKELVAKNDKSMRDIAQLKEFIQKNIFTPEETAIIEQLATNPIFDEFAARTTTTAAAIAAHTEITESETKLIAESTKVILGNLGGNIKSDEKLAELNKQILGHREKSALQKKEIFALEARAAELHPEMERVDAEIARWLEIGKSRTN